MEPLCSEFGSEVKAVVIHTAQRYKMTTHIVRLSGQSRGGLGFCGSRAGARGPLFVWGLSSPATNKEHLGFLIIPLPLMWAVGRRVGQLRSVNGHTMKSEGWKKTVESKTGRSPASPQTHQNMEQLLQHHFYMTAEDPRPPKRQANLLSTRKQSNIVKQLSFNWK